MIGSMARRAALILLMGMTSCVSMAGCSRCSPAKPKPPSSVASSSTASKTFADSKWTRVKPRVAAGASIKVEAEDFKSSNFPTLNPFAPMDQIEAAHLSGGQWIGAAHAAHPLTVTYDLAAKESGKYHVYARKFWKHGPFRWRVADGKWQACGGDVPLLDVQTLRKHVEVNWVALGEVELEEGTSEFEIRIDPPTEAVAFDAFWFSKGEVGPFGLLPRDQELRSIDEEWFVSEEVGPAQTEWETILSFPQSRGPIGLPDRITTKGSHFVRRGDGAGVRFWGVNANHALLDASPSAQRKYAQALSSRGVNLVRLGGPFSSPSSFFEVDTPKIPKLAALMSVLGSEGIYVALSIYFPMWGHLKASDGVSGYTGNPPYSWAYFSEGFDRGYRAWWKALLESSVGTSDLGEHPVLAYVELINEDSTLFWTFEPDKTIPKPQTKSLESLFGKWLAKRHGSAEQALEQWGGPRIGGDNPTEGRVGFLPLWNIAHDGTRRAKETAEYLATIMRERFEAWQKMIRDDLGYDGPTVCSNWHTADERILGPLDNWANSVCDVMDRHGYASGTHSGDGASYSVRVGQRYQDHSVLRPSKEGGSSAFPFVEPRYNEKPQMVSELGWPWPNRFRAEGPLLAAVYGVMLGLDGIVWTGTEIPFASHLSKFEAADPSSLGQFPAASRIFRAALLTEGKPIARLWLSKPELFSLRGTRVSSEPSLDASRQLDVARDRSTSSEMSSLSLMRGPIEVGLGTGTPSSRDWFADADGVPSGSNEIKSATGELSWDLKRGVVVFNAPRAAGVIGFLGGHRYSSNILDVELSNEYGTLALVSLDDQPLATSDRMLLQIGTETKNFGWSTRDEDDAHVITHVGTSPVLIRKVRGSFSIRRKDVESLLVTGLDEGGRPITEPLPATGRLTLLPDCLYYLIARK